jgi:signal transduction histidine kinase
MAADCRSSIVRADSAKLLQLLVNYLSNAIKFSPLNGEIVVDSKQTDGSITIRVTDSGTGMDDQVKAKVFEKHFQANTAERSQGFGLGLAICRLIADSHEWQVGVQSEPGRCSTFWMKIPAGHRIPPLNQIRQD